MPTHRELAAQAVDAVAEHLEQAHEHALVAMVYAQDCGQPSLAAASATTAKVLEGLAEFLRLTAAAGERGWCRP